MSRDYEVTQGKLNARFTVMEAFRKITGHQSLPKGSFCLALCGEQTDEPRHQINQYIASGFLQAKQFIGIDRDADVIARNAKFHPAANWAAGEFAMKFPHLISPDVVLVDLDTTAVGSAPWAAAWLSQAMQMAYPGTVIAYNVMMRDPYRGYNICESDVLESLAHHIPKRVFNGWRWHSTFPYTSLETPMRTFVLHLPKTAVRRRAA